MENRPPEGSEPGAREGGHPFFPDHFFKELLVVVIAGIILIIISAVRPASGFIGLPDLGATAPQVKFQPQWYLYYLYLGAAKLSPAVIMSLAVLLLGLLLATPLIDRNPSRKPTKRPLALAFTAVAVAAAIYMAGSGVKTTLAAGSVNIDGMKGIPCSSCHSYLKGVKTFEPTREACLKCHQDQGPAQGTFSPTAPMNFTCSTCHKPHIGKEPVSCQSCHADQSTQGLHSRSGHQTCTACHTPHTWNPPTDATVRATCLSCHTDKQEHNAGIPCTSCHKFTSG